jgi:putative glutamine amidotransferase
VESDLINGLDGVLLSGGGDVDPFFCGEEPLPGTGNISPERDAFEIGLARLALVNGLPVLGICRGIQVLNIAAGGGICQDITLVTSAPLKHAQQAPRWYPTHGLEIYPGSLLSSLLGGSATRVNSFHHQAVNRVADGFIVSAHSPDGVIEGIESVGSSYAVGVQFHTGGNGERDRKFLNIFKSLVEAAESFHHQQGESKGIYPLMVAKAALFWRRRRRC